MYRVNNNPSIILVKFDVPKDFIGRGGNHSDSANKSYQSWQAGTYVTCCVSLPMSARHAYGS